MVHPNDWLLIGKVTYKQVYYLRYGFFKNIQPGGPTWYNEQYSCCKTNSLQLIEI